MSNTGGYLNDGGGSIVEEITLPNTNKERFYDLDSLGNWIQSDYIPVGGTPTIDLRQHNKLNEITSRKVGSGSKSNFSYDANGNLRDDGTLLYDYDALNRLTEVRRKSDSQIIGQYVYDAQNRRVRKTISNDGLTTNIPNVTIDFIYRDWQVMQEINNSSTVAKQYVWGDYIDECIQLRTYTTSGAGNLAAGLYYPLQDLLYRTIVLTNASGEIVEAYDYDPYGNTLIFSTAGTGGNWWADDATQADYAASEVLYAGYRYDAESKTYQVRNRQYNPALGRWIQRDPIGFDGGDWNLYGYVSNDSINYIDPEGLAWPLIIVGGVAVSAGAVALILAAYGTLVIAQCLMIPSCARDLENLVRRAVERARETTRTQTRRRTTRRRKNDECEQYHRDCQTFWGINAPLPHEPGRGPLRECADCYDRCRRLGYGLMITFGSCRYWENAIKRCK